MKIIYTTVNKMLSNRLKPKIIDEMRHANNYIKKILKFYR